MEELEVIFKIEVKDKKLFVIYNKQKEGLYSYFSSDKNMYEYAHKNNEEAFADAIHEVDENTYILNIASTENFGAFEWKYAKDIADRQLSIFMPIIQRFIASSLTE